MGQVSVIIDKNKQRNVNLKLFPKFGQFIPLHCISASVTQTHDHCNPYHALVYFKKHPIGCSLPKDCQYLFARFEGCAFGYQKPNISILDACRILINKLM